MPTQEAQSRQLDGLMNLVEVTCRLAAQHDLDDVLGTVTTGACAALDCERASLFLYDAATTELFTRIVTELEIEEIRFPADRGVAGWVARSGGLANIQDPHADERWNPSFDRQTGFRTRNILAAPLRSVRDGRMVGVLQLLNKRAGGFESFDERLVEAFAAHAATALERAQLLEEARQHQELRLAVEMGRSIQASFLPQTLPAVPGYSLAAWWQPAESVSGDYYDAVFLPDGRLGLVVADVSGHGVGPSLLMASLRAMLRAVTREISDPGPILARLAKALYPDLQDSRFVTLLLGALDPVCHEFEFANAGHGPALHFSRRTGGIAALDATEMPLGVVEDLDPGSVQRLSLDPGDALLIGTDGAFELRNEDDEMFGIERLERLIVEHSHRPASDVLNAMRAAIAAFNPREHPPDDVTVLVVKRDAGPS
ncbi:MAG: SpoIIE family protein phosphatase [Planctomycetes bacterium]|nr:SpoIIE family protein phosphatase [Planctomycetota bacterium]